jgi:FMN phosphatase YigB (HAD superfamily)
MSSSCQHVVVVVMRGLLLDLGEVVSAAPWALLDDLEAATGRSFPHRGPHDPGGDPFWQRYLAGELSYLGYWIEISVAAGYDRWRDFYRDVGSLPIERFTDPDAGALIEEALSAGLRVGALTNDGAAINGMDFLARVPELRDLHCLLDAKEFGERKPDPGPYRRAAGELGLAPEEIVFLDDTAECVWGAEQVGMTGVLVDPADRRPAFDEARELLALSPPSEARRLVAIAEAAEASRDVDAIMNLFDPDIVIEWNGARVATGLDQARRFHEQLLERDHSDVRLRKRLRAATGDTLSVESRSSFARSDGSRAERVASEIWSLRRGKLVHWRRFATE